MVAQEVEDLGHKSEGQGFKPCHYEVGIVGPLGEIYNKQRILSASAQAW